MKNNIGSASGSTAKPGGPNYHDNANEKARHAGGQVLQQNSSKTLVPNDIRSEALSNNFNRKEKPVFTKGEAPAQKGVNTPNLTTDLNTTKTTTRQPPLNRKPMGVSPTHAQNRNNHNVADKATAARASKPAPPPQRTTTPPAKAEEEKLDEGEDSSHFFSDDDAFLALLDLGEGDLGQPVLPETDIGRPIGGDDEDGNFVRRQDLDEELRGIDGKAGSILLETRGSGSGIGSKRSSDAMCG